MVLGSGERKAGERSAKSYSAITEEAEREEEVDYYSGICPRIRIFWFILLVWYGGKERGLVGKIRYIIVSDIESGHVHEHLHSFMMLNAMLGLVNASSGTE